MVTLKVKTPKSQGYRRFNSIPPPIRFERAEWSKEKDDDLVSTFKLRTNPSDIDSQIFELKVRTYRTGTPEQFIMWKKDFGKGSDWTECGGTSRQVCYGEKTLGW